MLIHQPEDQLTLTTGIRCTDDRADLGIEHHFLQGFILGAGLLNDFILPLVGDDRQIILVPFLIIFCIGRGLCEGDEMADAPADNIVLADVAILRLHFKA